MVYDKILLAIEDMTEKQRKRRILKWQLIIEDSPKDLVKRTW